MATYKILKEHIERFKRENVIKENSETSKDNKLVGGKADNETIELIAKYWSNKGKTPYAKCLEHLKKELALGLKIEGEHTDDKETAKEIALDHLKEDKNYYTDKKPKDWASKEIADEKKENK